MSRELEYVVEVAGKSAGAEQLDFVRIRKKRSITSQADQPESGRVVDHDSGKADMANKYICAIFRSHIMW